MSVFKKIILVRIVENNSGTFGVLLDRKSMRNEYVPFATTLELKWRNNIKDGSCIPADEYECKRIKSGKFGEVFEVQNVQGRDHILLHCGNTIKDSSGCILVGEQFGILGGLTGILSSRKGYKELLTRLKGFDTFLLDIKKTIIKRDYMRI